MALGIEARIISLKAPSGPQGTGRVSGFVVKQMGLGPERPVGLPESQLLRSGPRLESRLVTWPHAPPLGTRTTGSEPPGAAHGIQHGGQQRPGILVLLMHSASCCTEPSALSLLPIPFPLGRAVGSQDPQAELRR